MPSFASLDIGAQSVDLATLRMQLFIRHAFRGGQRGRSGIQRGGDFGVRVDLRNAQRLRCRQSRQAERQNEYR